MNKGFNEERFQIELLSRRYLTSKRIVRESQEAIKGCPRRELEMHRRIMYHIEYVTQSLDDNDRFIIEKEVIEGRRGKWYSAYFSPTAYYRHRKKAYDSFLRCL